MKNLVVFPFVMVLTFSVGCQSLSVKDFTVRPTVQIPNEALCLVSEDEAVPGTPPNLTMIPVTVINISADKAITTNTGSGVGEESSKSFFDMLKSIVPNVVSYFTGL